MKTLGSNQTNAYTTLDCVVYEENIPSNQIENWAKVQADCFEAPVIRMFNTELATIYEEYNKYFNKDKVHEAVFSALFPHHPYGKPIIGLLEHIKNPSIKNIRTFFDTYYRPNNMAICMCGDFNPEQTIKIIDKYFGVLKAKDIPETEIQPEKPIDSPIVKNIIDNEIESVTLTYRLPKIIDAKEIAIMEFVDRILSYNIHIDLVEKYKISKGSSDLGSLKDYGICQLYGIPNDKQALEEVYLLFLTQIEKLKTGTFSEDLLEATANNLRRSQYRQQESPEYLVHLFTQSFVTGYDWKNRIEKIDIQSKLTKHDVVDFCNKYFNSNHVVVYKRQGNCEDVHF
jgi:predicted Zn-dependent peptidase